MLISENGFLPEPSVPIFFRREYIGLHGGTYYQVVENGRALTGIWLKDGRSPGRATFGGLSQKVRAELAHEFLQEIALKHGLREVVLPPCDHDPEHAAIQINALSRLGFQMTPDLNYSAIIDSSTLAERMEDGNRKKLEKCRAAGFRAWELHRSDWGRAHAILTANRERSGHTLSMTFEDVLRLAEAFPNGIMTYYGVSAEHTLMAAALALDITPTICYVYAWGDSEKSEYAPTVMLAEEIYSSCRSRQIKIMDVGISTENGIPNHGLIGFKRSLGFRGSLKATMRYSA